MTSHDRRVAGGTGNGIRVLPMALIIAIFLICLVYPTP